MLCFSIEDAFLNLPTTISIPEDTAAGSLIFKLEPNDPGNAYYEYVFNPQEAESLFTVISNNTGKYYVIYTNLAFKLHNPSAFPKLVGEKGRDLTQSCDKNPYIHRIIQKAT